jgi:anti-sigma-K factor RskA
VNVEEYISSGILEAYALGELPPREAEEVEKNLLRYPALREELDLIEKTQEVMCLRAAIAPPPSIKNNILEATQPKGKVVPLESPAESETVLRWKYAAAASIGIALFTSYMAYSYWTKWRSSQNELTTLIAQNQQIAQDYNKVNFRLDQMEDDLKVMGNPSFERVIMKGTPNAPQALASVYWNRQTEEVFVSIQNMRALSKEKQYQLWAIIDGKPVDAGVFDGNLAGLVKMKNIAKGAVTFAVTIEDAGGKPSPSLETMQVAGNVSKG